MTFLFVMKHISSEFSKNLTIRNQIIDKSLLAVETSDAHYISTCFILRHYFLVGTQSFIMWYKIVSFNNKIILNTKSLTLLQV